MWKSMCASRGSGQRVSAPVLGSVGLGVVVGVGGLHDLEVAPVGPGQVGELDRGGLAAYDYTASSMRSQRTVIRLIRLMVQVNKVKSHSPASISFRAEPGSSSIFDTA